MPIANIEWTPLLRGGLEFASYMVLAIFAENVILARALGVTRLLKLVPDHKAQIWDFSLPLILVMGLSAPLGWAAHNLFFPWLRNYLPVWLPISALRPLVYLTCGSLAMALTWLMLFVLPPASGLPCSAYIGRMQYRCIGHTADLCQPELHHAAKHCLWYWQCAGLCVYHLYRSRRPPSSAQ